VPFSIFQFAVANSSIGVMGRAFVFKKHTRAIALGFIDDNDDAGAVLQLVWLA
jgi:hypothetical protein